MPCYQSNDGKITLCSPTVTRTKVKYLFCPRCNCKRRVTMKFQEWYGWNATCTAKRLKWAHYEPCNYNWQWE